MLPCILLLEILLAARSRTKIEKVNFNAYNDNDESTDEEALEAAIRIEAKKMRPKMKNTNLDRN